MVAANISGLPFINQTYNTETGNNTNTATLTTFQFPRATGLTQSRMDKNTGKIK